MDDKERLSKRLFRDCRTGREIKLHDTINRARHVRIMQWNILADALSHSSVTENFVKCGIDVLQWPERQERILSDILLYSPDIVCLEEVDHFHDYFGPKLQEHGYNGCFMPKPDSPCLRVAGHSSPDGCAIFTQNIKWEMMTTERVQLKDEHGLPSNQVAILAILNLRQSDFKILVVVTHLKAKEGNEGIRLAQGKDLLSNMEHIKSADGNGALPVVICGDFNASPNEPVYGEMKENGLLTSAYVSATKNEAEYTTWKFRPNAEVCRTIDYVWHSSQLIPRNILEVPSKKTIGETALPSLEFPSDHLSLLFDFELLTLAQ